MERDLRKATGFYRRAANAGSLRAQLILDHCYKNGYGVQKDMDKAVELCRRVATVGAAKASTRLGLYHDDGVGVEAIWLGRWDSTGERRCSVNQERGYLLFSAEDS